MKKALAGPQRNAFQLPELRLCRAILLQNVTLLHDAHVAPEATRDDSKGMVTETKLTQARAADGKRRHGSPLAVYALRASGMLMLLFFRIPALVAAVIEAANAATGRGRLRAGT